MSFGRWFGLVRCGAVSLWFLVVLSGLFCCFICRNIIRFHLSAYRTDDMRGGSGTKISRPFSLPT